MSKITYKVVKHDGGWAYEANGTYSEPFPTRDLGSQGGETCGERAGRAGRDDTDFLRGRQRTLAHRGRCRNGSPENRG
jgi:hypothetical protein